MTSPLLDGLQNARHIAHQTTMNCRLRMSRQPYLLQLRPQFGFGCFEVTASKMQVRFSCINCRTRTDARSAFDLVAPGATLRANFRVIARTPFILVALFVMGLPSLAEDSLLDKSNARGLTTAQQAFFGPRSAARRYDPRMIRAAEIALRRAQPRQT